MICTNSLEYPGRDLKTLCYPYPSSQGNWVAGTKPGGVLRDGAGPPGWRAVPPHPIGDHSPLSEEEQNSLFT